MPERTASKREPQGRGPRTVFPRARTSRARLSRGPVEGELARRLVVRVQQRATAQLDTPPRPGS